MEIFKALCASLSFIIYPLAKHLLCAWGEAIDFDKLLHSA